MNPGASHGIGLEVHDLLRGKKINQDKSTAFCFADLRFSNSFNCANLLNLLSYRHEGFAGRYATRKIQTASRVAQASVRKSDSHMHPQLHEINFFLLIAVFGIQQLRFQGLSSHRSRPGKKVVYPGHLNPFSLVLF